MLLGTVVGVMETGVNGAFYSFPGGRNCVTDVFHPCAEKTLSYSDISS